MPFDVRAEETRGSAGDVLQTRTKAALVEAVIVDTSGDYPGETSADTLASLAALSTELLQSAVIFPRAAREAHRPA